MALTADEKRRFAKKLIQIAYEKLNITARVDVPTIESAAEEIHDYLNSVAVQTAINNQFSEPFKSNASAAEKAIIVAVAALFLAGELPN